MNQFPKMKNKIDELMNELNASLEFNVKLKEKYESEYLIKQGVVHKNISIKQSFTKRHEESLMLHIETQKLRECVNKYIGDVNVGERFLTKHHNQKIEMNDELNSAKNEFNTVKQQLIKQSELMTDLDIKIEELEFDIALKKLDIRFDEKSSRLMYEEGVNFLKGLNRFVFICVQSIVNFPVKIISGTFIVKGEL